MTIVTVLPERRRASVVKKGFTLQTLYDVSYEFGDAGVPWDCPILMRTTKLSPLDNTKEISQIIGSVSEIELEFTAEWTIK